MGLPGGVAPLGAFAAITLIWGSTFLAIRVALDAGYEPFSAALARVLPSALVLAALAAALRVPWPRGRALAASVVAGTLIFGVNFVLLFWAERTVPSSWAAVLWGIYPALVALGAGAVLQAEPLTRRGLGGALVAAAGIAVIFAAPAAAASLPGLAAILGGILAGTVGSLLLKRWGHAVHPLAFNALGNAASLPLVGAAAWGLGAGLAAPPTPLAWLATGYLVVAGTLAFLLWAWLLQRWPATRLAYQTVLSPLVAVLLGAALLAEPLGPRFLAGAALVLLGTWLAVAAPRPPRGA